MVCAARQAETLRRHRVRNQRETRSALRTWRLGDQVGRPHAVLDEPRDHLGPHVDDDGGEGLAFSGQGGGLGLGRGVFWERKTIWVDRGAGSISVFQRMMGPAVAGRAVRKIASSAARAGPIRLITSH